VNQNKSKDKLINWELVSINPNDKNWDWKDLFCFWGNNIQSVIGFSLIASLYLVYELNVIVVLFGTLIASILVYFLANLIGKPSQKYGLPFPVILRSSLGIKGAKYFGLFRGLVGIFMFGIQTYFLSRLFSYLIRISIFSFDNTFLDHDIFLIFLLGLNIIEWVSLVFTIILQALLFSKSHQFNRSIIRFSAITVYSGMLIFFLTVFLYDVKVVSTAFVDIFSINNLFDKNNLAPLITVVGSVFAYFSIVIVNYGDFSRYIKNENELKNGNLSLILNLLIFSVFAVFIVIGSDIFLNKNLENMERILTNPTDIIGKIDNTELTIIVLFFIIFSSVSTNLIANYIPTQNTLLNFLPTKLSLKTSAFIIGFFGFIIGIFWLPLLSQIGILSFIDTFAAFFGPLFGVMVIDYYLVKKTNLNNKDIFSLESKGAYFYSNGWHIKAIYSLVIGFIFAASTIWNESLMTFHSYSWMIGAFTSSLTYYMLVNK
jgi:nucleobase:cation symporter-1, NCS1 family|tara:strand:+ start:287 stop:1744 length:1458 start_codon:yes stop_codon:yes gene_type:complete